MGEVILACLTGALKTAGAAVAQDGLTKLAVYIKNHCGILRNTTNATVVSDISTYLFDDGFPRQLQDIQECLNKFGITLETKMENINELGRFRDKYDNLLSMIFFTEKALEEFLECQDSAISRSRFLKVYEQNKPAWNVEWLFQKLIKRPNNASCVAHDLHKLCNRDWELYVSWYRSILSTVARVQLLVTSYYWTILKWHSNSTEECIAFLLGNLSVSHIDFNEIREIHSRTLRQLDHDNHQLQVQMERELTTLKSRFLIDPCPDHSHCGAPDAASCFELGAKVYSELRSPNCSASRLAELLRKDYSQFEWAVVLTDLPKDCQKFLYLEKSYKNVIRHVEMTSTKKHSRRKHTSKLLSDGFEFGYLTCCRWLDGKSRKRAWVFWTGAQNILEIDSPLVTADHQSRVAECNTVRNVIHSPARKGLENVDTFDSKYWNNSSAPHVALLFRNQDIVFAIEEAYGLRDSEIDLVHHPLVKGNTFPKLTVTADKPTHTLLYWRSKQHVSQTPSVSTGTNGSGPPQRPAHQQNLLSTTSATAGDGGSLSPDHMTADAGTQQKPSVRASTGARFSLSPLSLTLLYLLLTVFCSLICLLLGVFY